MEIAAHVHEWDGTDPAVAPHRRAVVPDRSGVSAALAQRRPDVLSSAAMLRLQRDAGNRAVTELVDGQRSPVHDVISSAGTSLDSQTRVDMESRLGHDFGDVRVHQDAAADASARSVGAHAYTTGNHVVFQRDAYDPSSKAGRLTLAHELTHVVQQRSGPVEGTPTGGGVRVSDPDDRFERAATETAVHALSQPAPVQRQESPEEEVVESAPGITLAREMDEDADDESG